MVSRLTGLISMLCLLGCPPEESTSGSDNPWASPPGSDPAPPVLDIGGGPGTAGGAVPSPSTDACQPAAYALEAHPQGSETVTISGTVAGLTGQGSMIIELVRPDSKVSTYGFACPMSSEFALPIPAGLGVVGVAVFVDGNGNGPDSTDIAGRHSEHIEIKAQDISGLTITVSESPDLGDLSPPFSMPNAPRDDLPSGDGERPAGEGAGAPGGAGAPEGNGDGAQPAGEGAGELGGAGVPGGVGAPGSGGVPGSDGVPEGAGAPGSGGVPGGEKPAEIDEPE